MPTAVEFGHGGNIRADIYGGGGGSGFVLNLPTTSHAFGDGGGAGFTFNLPTISHAYGDGGGAGFTLNLPTTSHAFGDGGGAGWKDQRGSNRRGCLRQRLGRGAGRQRGGQDIGGKEGADRGRILDPAAQSDTFKHAGIHICAKQLWREQRER